MTDEEYERLREASSGGGARSVSEFARNVLLNPARSNPPAPGTVSPCDCQILNSLDARLTTVEQEVAQVKEELQMRPSVHDVGPCLDVEEN